MYLSRFALNPARRGTGRLLASPQRMHAAVMAAYPPGLGVRPLWRVDRRSRHELLLYLVASAEPDLTHLVEQAGWPTSAAWDTTAYDHFLDSLGPGQAWRFRLTANPVRAVASGRGRRGKPVPVGSQEKQEEWLRERSAQWGFTLEGSPNGVSLTGRGQDVFTRREHVAEKGCRVTITRAQFDGLLTVTDPARLRAALTTGMGRAKAYGCGLMTLARPR